MTVEVIGLKATPAPGGVQLSWGVSSTSYLTGFELVALQAGNVVERLSLGATARSATVSVTGTGYSWDLRCTVETGGKTVACDPLPENTEGQPLYRLDANNTFNSYVGETAWLNEHVAVVKAYPFEIGDEYLKRGLTVTAYRDPANEGYSPLTPALRAEYVAKVKEDMAAGYSGVFIDDVNWGLAFRDNQQNKASVEPEAAELANLIEAVRAQIGPSAILEINSQYHDIWPLMKAKNAHVERALAHVSHVTKEFGVTATSAIDTGQDYRELLEYADALHSKGIHVVLCGDENASTVAAMEYNLATYFLLTDGHDLVNGHEQHPGSFWAGYEVDLKGTLGPRSVNSVGVHSRSFAAGVVYTLEPGRSPQSIPLAEPYKTVTGETVTSLSLTASTGAVLLNP